MERFTFKDRIDAQISAHDEKLLVAHLDKDGDGKIDYIEFKDFAYQSHETENRRNQIEMKKLREALRTHWWKLSVKPVALLLFADCAAMCVIDDAPNQACCIMRST